MDGHEDLSIATFADALAINFQTQTLCEGFSLEDYVLLMDSKLNFKCSTCPLNINFSYTPSVVTGVRFAEENRIIFLQPQVGKLLPMGLIDAATIHWMGLPSHPLLVGLNVAGLNDRFNLGTINKLASNQVVTGKNVSVNLQRMLFNIFLF